MSENRRRWLESINEGFAREFAEGGGHVDKADVDPDLVLALELLEYSKCKHTDPRLRAEWSVRKNALIRRLKERLV